MVMMAINLIDDSLIDLPVARATLRIENVAPMQQRSDFLCLLRVSHRRLSAWRHNHHSQRQRSFSLAPSWRRLGPTWRRCRPAWRHRHPTWRRFSPSWQHAGHLDNILTQLCATQAPSGRHVGSLWILQRPSLDQVCFKAAMNRQ